MMFFLFELKSSNLTAIMFPKGGDNFHAWDFFLGMVYVCMRNF